MQIYGTATLYRRLK